MLKTQLQRSVLGVGKEESWGHFMGQGDVWAGGSARCLGRQSPDGEMEQSEWLERGLHTRPGLWHQCQNSLSKSPKDPHSVSDQPVASGLASLLFHLFHPRSGESVQALGVLEMCPHRPKPFAFALMGRAPITRDQLMTAGDP